MIRWWKSACAVSLLWAATAIASSAQTFTTLLSFDAADNSNANAGLVQGFDGDFYGTSVDGGPAGNGAAFKVKADGTLTTLHTFDGTDGAFPFGALVLGTDGNFYGTTYNGGVNGDGTVFKMTPSGTLTTLHSFEATDGLNPYGGLIQGADGYLYGTTIFGGPNRAGAAFKISTSGVFTTLHLFTGGSDDGAYPYGALVQASDGNFYGTTFSGGGADEGIVFKITSGGTLTAIHSFCLQGVPCPDGGNNVAGLVQGSDGFLYGATGRGGLASCLYKRFAGCGVAYKISLSGTLKILHPFQGTEGASPLASLVQGTDGNFYGTTNGHGVYGWGTVFQLTSSGLLTTLHNFDGTDGASPGAGTVIQGTDGTFYGVTPSGGAGDAGTVFNLAMGLGPFIETVPSVAKVGVGVRILGTNLTGATSVTFNGVPASFTVVSPTLINTTVPAGATTGSVQVTIPSGTLSSNVAFRVKP